MEKILSYNFEGTRYDIGDKLGFVKATIDFALLRGDLQDDIKTYMQQKLAEDTM